MLTYAELLKLVSDALRRERGVSDAARDPQTLVNRRYHLRMLMRAAGKSENEAIEGDFTDAFDRLCELAVKSVRSPRTQGDVRRGLRWWRERYRELLTNHQRGAGKQPVGSFATALYRHIAKCGMTHANVAEIVGVPNTTVSSWLQGVIPGAQSVRGLRRLESALAIQPGTLTNLTRQPKPEMTAPPANSYRETLGKLRKDRYRLALSEVNPQLREEWKSLLHYKTTKAPALRRSRRAVWSLTSTDEGRRSTDWHNARGTSFCAAADVEWKHVAGFFGFLRNKPDVHGCVLPTDWDATLAAFAVPELIEPYFAWLIERAGGVANNRVKTLANFVQSLTNSVTGWLTQQPELRERLPEKFRSRVWAEACAAANTLATGFRGEVRGVSRDPFEPLRGLLSLPEPFEPILQAIQRLDARALGAGLQSVTAALAKRDALLLTVLISIPLRLRNVALLRYRMDGTGTLRKEPDNRWWIRIPPHETKNRKAIEAPLPKSATARVDEYVTIYRPRLLVTTPNDYAFVSSGSRAGPWWAVNMRVFDLTKIYLPGNIGFHIHAFRHLVATRWLDKHPQDYMTVAHLLGDDLQTVIKTYSRPSPARAIDKASLDIDALMTQ